MLRLTCDHRYYSLDTRAAVLKISPRMPEETNHGFEWRVRDAEIRRDHDVEDDLERSRDRRRPWDERKHFDARRSQPCARCGSWHAPIVTCEQAAKGWGISDVCDD